MILQMDIQAQTLRPDGEQTACAMIHHGPPTVNTTEGTPDYRRP